MPCELDALEWRAGITGPIEQAAFWRQFNHLSPRAMLAEGRAELERRALASGCDAQTIEDMEAAA